MREQQQAAAERAAPKSVAPKSAAEKPAAKPMPSRRVEWLIHNSTAVVEEVLEDETRLVLHEARRSRQYQSYICYIISNIKHMSCLLRMTPFSFCRIRDFGCEEMYGSADG